MLLPAECLEQLKCFLCKCLLSRFPIYVTEDEDDQLLYVCGRCEVPSDNKKYLRVTIYESVMKNAQFPCINREHGCREYLLPKNIEQHELACQYQLKQCKICEWEGEAFTVFDHYQTKHADLILENYEFKMNTKEDSKSSNIVLHRGAIFFFERNFDQNMKRIRCSLTPLFSTRNVKKYYAQINLEIDDTTLSKRFPGIDVDENEPKSININIENLLNDDRTEATGIINITNNIKEFSIQKQDENLSESKCNADTYALCTTITKFNNLQSLSNQLNLTHETCQYGCGYITSNASDLKQHYNGCLNKPYNCLFTCNENNQLRDCEELICRKDLEEHIRKKHNSDFVRLTNHESLINIGTSTRKRHCKLLYSDLDYIYCFILIIEHLEPNLFLWRVEKLHSTKNINDFTFQIAMSNKSKGVELLLRAHFAKLTCKKKYNINDTPCIWLHLDHIKHFIDNNTLSFKIHFYKG